MQPTGTCVTDFGARADAATDNTPAFEAALAAIATAGGGTLQVPDGAFGIARTLDLPRDVSLLMTPGAVIRALPDFAGDAVIRKGREEERGQHGCYGAIRGGTIDGGAHTLTGILVPYACRLHIGDLEVRNARMKGIHIGTAGWYECNVSNVRCSLDPEVENCPGSIGLHYEKCTDSLVNSVVIIGYETGVRSDSSSNDFHQVHVWNFNTNGALKYCFYCNGWNDSWNQCYADSPITGDETGYGFYVDKPFNRITACRVYCNQWATDNKTVGIYISDGGTHGTYMANHFTAREEHRIARAFDGNLDSACILGNSYAPTVSGGRSSRTPPSTGSATSSRSW